MRALREVTADLEASGMSPDRIRAALVELRNRNYLGFYVGEWYVLTEPAIPLSVYRRILAKTKGTQG
jgi:hypothetical protein